jgi:5,10-methylenetetrahydromethanopterin reductase
MAVEFWTMGRGTSAAGNPKFLDSASQAARAEELGYDGIVYVDSQNLAGDCYVAMALAAQATSTIKLGTGVTNSFTRHPAVTASAIATV